MVISKNRCHCSMDKYSASLGSSDSVHIRQVSAIEVSALELFNCIHLCMVDNMWLCA